MAFNVACLPPLNLSPVAPDRPVATQSGESHACFSFRKSASPSGRARRSVRVVAEQCRVRGARCRRVGRGHRGGAARPAAHQTGRFSEFDAAGALLFDANVPSNWDTYRAYLFVWHATPDTKPTASAQRNADGSVTVHAIWNGATDVARWIVLTGEHANLLWPSASADWNGLDTTVTLKTKARELVLVAQSRDGRLLARSAAIAIASP